MIKLDNTNSTLTSLNCPEWFPRLCEKILMGLPEQKRRQWESDMTQQIQAGFSDWQNFYHKLCIFSLEKICRNTDYPIVKQPIAGVILLHRIQENMDSPKWDSARYNAEDATCNTSGIRGPRLTPVVCSAHEAARCAAWSTWGAIGFSVWSACESAAWDSVDSLEKGDSGTWKESRQKAYAKIAEKIVLLLTEEGKVS